MSIVDGFDQGSESIDVEEALKVVKVDRRKLLHCTKDAKSNKQVVLRAVTQFGVAIQYASKKLRDDKEVVLAAMRSHGRCPRAFDYSSDRLKGDKELLMLVASWGVEVHGWMGKGGPAYHLRGDRELVALAIKNNGLSLKVSSSYVRPGPVRVGREPMPLLRALVPEICA